MAYLDDISGKRQSKMQSDKEAQKEAQLLGTIADISGKVSKVSEAVDNSAQSTKQAIDGMANGTLDVNVKNSLNVSVNNLDLSVVTQSIQDLSKETIDVNVKNLDLNNLINAIGTISYAKGEKGKDGKDGVNGKDGKSGKDGKNGRDGKDGKTPVKNKDYFDGKDGRDGKDGIDGVDGKSAYELAVIDGFDGTLEDWLKSLKGKDGVNTFVTNGNNPYATVPYSGGSGGGSGDMAVATYDPAGGARQVAFADELPDVTGLVPYTGATGDVDLGANKLTLGTDLDGNSITGKGISAYHAGQIGLADVTGTDSGGDVYIYAGSGQDNDANGGKLGLGGGEANGTGDNGHVVIYALPSYLEGALDMDNITDNQTYTFPDATGTVALTSDIPSITNLFNTTTDTLDDIADGTTYVKSENNYDDAAVSKLSGIEAGADVTDATNVVSALSGATLSGSLVAADHGTASTAQIINVCYGTGAAPAASTTPEGTLYITYTA